MLRAERAVHLPALDTLLVADLHLGKAQAFRRQGLPVPGGTTRETLARLDALLAACPAAHLAILGDLLHSHHAHGSPALDALAQWRARHAALAITLVRGNHDDRAGDPPAALGIALVDEPFALGPFDLRHRPVEGSARPAFAGHVHPGLSLHGRADDHLRLPCFHLAPGCLVLPAFGAFTGLHVVRPRPGERVFVVADGRVQEC